MYNLHTIISIAVMSKQVIKFQENRNSLSQNRTVVWNKSLLYQMEAIKVKPGALLLSDSGHAFPRRNKLRPHQTSMKHPCHFLPNRLCPRKQNINIYWKKINCPSTGSDLCRRRSKYVQILGRAMTLYDELDFVQKNKIIMNEATAKRSRTLTIYNTGDFAAKSSQCNI